MHAPALATSRTFTLLQRWVRFARGHLHPSPDNPAWCYYGSGESGWGMQTVQKALLAFSVVATDPGLDPRLTGASREALLADALALLRYSLATHRSGPATCVDLAQWGQTWISALGLERSFPAFRLLEPWLTTQDRARIREVLLSEAAWLLRDYPVRAGLLRNNHPEANLWNAALLWKIGALYPGDLEPMALRAKVDALVRHSISTPADLARRTPAQLAADGPELEANFFESLALHHHRYLNTGYMAICLSQLAFLHYDCQELGLPEPEGWWQNSRELWQLLRDMTLPDGRLIRIGGDTRVRYCYCQDYHTLLWHLAADRWGDAATASGFLQGWLGVLERECEANGDGSFLSERCHGLREVSPLYYHRLESDRAASLAFSHHWKRTGLSCLREAPSAPPPAAPVRQWADTHHGAHLLRTPGGVFSWVWRAAEPVQGLIVPSRRSDLAEWRMNLGGEISGTGRRNAQEVELFHSATWEGGFATAGSVVHISDGWLAEGQLPARLARQINACIVWEETLFLFQYCTALRRGTLQSLKGLHLNVPNDVFNHGTRTYRSGNAVFESRLGERAPESVTLPGQVLTIDDALTLQLLHGGPGFALHRPRERNLNAKRYAERDYPANPGTLWSELVCAPLRLGPLEVEKGEVLYDLSCRLNLGPEPVPGETVEAIGNLPAQVRGIRLERQGRVTLEIYLNIGPSPIDLPFTLRQPLALLATEAAPAGGTRLGALGLAIGASSEKDHSSRK